MTSANSDGADLQSQGKGPARGHSWPPFQPGHQLSRTHGAYSVNAIAERAKEVHLALLEVAPWLNEERYAPTVHRYLMAAAREALADKALTESARFSPRLAEAATAAARLAWSMADALGLTPGGHARLKVLVAEATSAETSIADLAERGRAIREARASEFAAERSTEAPESSADYGELEGEP